MKTPRGVFLCYHEAMNEPIPFEPTKSRKTGIEPTRQELTFSADSNYEISQQGALKFIVDKKTGQPVSDGFHDIFVYEQGDDEGTVVRGVIGQIGAAQHPLSIPTEPGGRFDTNTEGYHSVEYRFDLGYFTGKTGASICLLDSTTGEKLSRGYHSIRREGDRLFGTLGSSEEEIALPISASQLEPGQGELEA